MNFFESYADAVLQELNEDGSNIGDIVVDWESLLLKENTNTSNNTSATQQSHTKHNVRPFKDGNMPGRTNDAFKPRDVEEAIKLSKIWRNNNTTELNYSNPMHLKNNHVKGDTRIVRKVSKTFRRKQTGNK